MQGCPHDLRDYLFDELTPTQRAEVESYLETSGEAREELQRLKLTHSALLGLPEEEVPRRVAFVSDKVFEPSRAMRFWREFWSAAPRLAFGMAAVLLAVFGGLWLVQPTVTVDDRGWQVAFGRTETAVQPAPQAVPVGLTEEDVRQSVLQAIADHEEQQGAVLAEMISESQDRPAVSQGDIAQMRQEMREMRQDFGDSYAVMRNSIEKLWDSVEGQITLASSQR